MLNEEEDAGRTLFADSAYSGKNLEELTRSFNVNPCFCEKGYANTPLTELQQKLNHLKSKYAAALSTSLATLKPSSKARLCAQSD